MKEFQLGAFQVTVCNRKVTECKGLSQQPLNNILQCKHLRVCVCLAPLSVCPSTPPSFSWNFGPYPGGFIFSCNFSHCSRLMGPCVSYLDNAHCQPCLLVPEHRELRRECQQRCFGKPANGPNKKWGASKGNSSTHTIKGDVNNSHNVCYNYIQDIYIYMVLCFVFCLVLSWAWVFIQLNFDDCFIYVI